MNEQCSIFDFVDDNYIYKINKPIRLIEFFAGVGAQHKALTNIKANFESYKICEWALPSIIGYNAIHLGNFNGIWDNENDKNKIAQFLYDKGVSLNYNEPATLEQLKRVDIEKLRQCANSIVNLHNLVDISRVKGDTLEVADKDKYTYMLTYSYPCITEDSLILTKDGYKQYKDLQVGEYVLTKSNTWQKIAKKFDNGIHKTYYLQGMGFENIHCTANHKFYVREKYREGHQGIRKFKDDKVVEGWLVPDKHSKTSYCLLPILSKESILNLGYTIITFTASNIKYLAYLSGACMFKGYGKYLIPIFMNESSEKILRRIKILKDKSLANLLEEDIEFEENSKPKRFAVLDTGAIIDLETYGLLSWGDNYQYSIDIKGNKVYENYWSYGGEWEEDTNEETLLGTIVYSSDKPLFISEASSAIGYTKKPEYVEYGANLKELFFSDKEDSNNV